MKEKNILEKAKTDCEAFVELYRQFVPLIHRFFCFRVSDQETSEDLTSQTWEKILKNIKKFKGEDFSSFKAWIFQIARNLLYDFYKENGKNKTQSLEEWNQNELFENSESEISLSKQLDHKLESAKIRQIIVKLPDKQKSSILLKYFDGLKNKEIAVILNISEKTVASNLSRALEKIKKNLNAVNNLKNES